MAGKGGDANRKKGKATAAGQALGFSLQYTRMTHWLLTAKEGSQVGFEVLDDTHVEHPDGTIILEQSKSSLSANSFANRSSDLWKTLANWIDIIEDNNFDLAKLKLIIYSSKPASGSIATAFENAKTSKLAQAAFNEAKATLWHIPENGDAPYYNVSEKAKFHIEKFFSNPDLAEVVIIAFQCESSSGYPEQDLIKEFYQIIPERQSAVAHHMCGWTRDKIDNLIRSNQQALISREDFLHEMHSYNKKHTERDILESLAPNPTGEQQEDLQLQLFVRQLELIDLSFEDRLEAIRKYFKSAWDRAQWANDGLVYINSFDELDERLLDTWKNHKRIVDITHSEKEAVARGKLLLSNCLMHKDKLENCEAPNHFIPGCFHLLADEPNLGLGWHPDYATKLKQ